jgi:hypothetical protein
MGQWYSQPWVHAEYDHPNLKNCKNRWTFWNVCVAFGEGFGRVSSIADMSCGDGRIPRSLASFSGIEPILGDYAGGYAYQGTLQETVPQLSTVDLYVCTNTIEHLEDPDGDLTLIREHCNQLLLACPIDEHDAGGEHVWMFTKDGVDEMLLKTGFERMAYCELDMNPVWEHLKFGMWACR